MSIDIFHRFLQHKSILIGVALIALIIPAIVSAIVAPLFGDPNKMDFTAQLASD